MKKKVLIINTKYTIFGGEDANIQQEINLLSSEYDVNYLEFKNTKDINFYGGLGQKMSKFSVFFLIFTLGAIGFPGTSGFVGEYLTLLSVYSKNTLVAFLSATGVILAASYMLILYKKVFLGVVSEKIDKKTERLNIFEVFTYSILAVVIFIFGIKPNLILDYTSSSLERIIKLYPISIF